MIGQSVPRIEDEPLLRGQARFIDDIDLPGVGARTEVRLKAKGTSRPMRASATAVAEASVMPL